MGVASSVAGAVDAIGHMVNGQPSNQVDIPISQINDTHATNQRIRNDCYSSLSSIDTVIRKIDASGGKFQDLSFALEIVNDSDELMDNVNNLKGQWVQVQNQINAILLNVKEPSIWQMILSGVVGGPVGLALSVLKTQQIAAMQATYRSFSAQTVTVQSDLFSVSKKIKDLDAQGKAVMDQATQDIWGRFIPSMRSNCVTLQASLNDMLKNADQLDSTLRQLAGNRPVNFFVTPVKCWSEKNPDNFPNVITVDITVFPQYAGTTKKLSGKKRPTPTTPSGTKKQVVSKSAVRTAQLLQKEPSAKPKTMILTETDQMSPEERKKIVAAAQQKAFDQVNGHLQGQKDAMASDITKYSAVDVAVSQATPAKTDDNNNVWDQFAVAAKNIEDWASNFVTAMQDAPIEDTTRREIFDVCQNFYHLLQTTSLKLGNYRLSIGKIAAAMEQVVFVLVPPDDIKESLRAMQNDKAKVAEVQKFAAMNKDALSTNLKQLSTLLNDHKALDDLNNLHSKWSDLQKSIETVQADVKKDIEAFKKKMKIIGWITMGITAVIGLVVVIGTAGAAAPEVAAVAAEEVAEEAALEAAEVGTEVAVDTMVDGAVDAAVDAGEAEAEAESSVTSIGSKAMDIFTKIGKGLLTIGVLSGVTYGEKELIDKLTDMQLQVINDAKKGLDDLSNDANLIEMMLFFIYKHWSELDQDPILSATDPLKPYQQAWGRINVKPLMDHLASSQDTLATIQKELQDTENDIDVEITNYNSKVYQPLLKMFG